MKHQFNSIMTMAALCLVISILSFSNAIAQDYSNCSLDARWAEGNCYAVEVEDDLGFYATGGLLRILNISDVTNPIELGDFACNGRIQGIKKSGDYLYLVGGINGFFKVLDISNPTLPVEAGALAIPRGLNIELDGQYAYVSGESYGLFIIDISNPAVPTLVSQIKPSGSVNSMTIVGQKLYAATGSHGFSVIDIQDKSDPVILNEIEVSDYVRGSAIDQNYLYLAATNGGLFIYHIENDPVYVSTFDEGGHAEDVVVKNDIAYVANRYAGVYTLDVSDPQNPVSLDAISTRRAAKISINENHALIADTWAFTILDISNTTDLSSAYSKDVATNTMSIDIQNNTLFVASQYQGFQVIDIVDPELPRHLHTFTYAGGFNKISVHDTVAYIARGDELLLVNIKDQMQPQVLGTLDLGESITDIDVHENIAYVTFYNQGLRTIDVSTPTIPTVVGSFPYDHQINDVLIFGQYVFLSCRENGLIILDASNVKVPVEIARIETDSKIESATIVGTRIYVAEGGDGIRIFDLMTPQSPMEIGRFNTVGWANTIAIHGRYAFVASNTDGLRILDMTDMGNITEAAYYISGERAIDVKISNDHIFLADQEDGIYILSFDSLAVSVHEVSTPGLAEENIIQAVYPNPFSDELFIEIVSPLESQLTLSIFNIGGQILTTQKLDHPGDEPLKLKWSGSFASKDDEFDGIYFIEVMAGHQRQIVKVIRQGR